MEHPIEWFIERIPKTIKRRHKDTPVDKRPSYVQLKDKRVVKYHYNLQSNDYIYEDNEPQYYGTGTGKGRVSGDRFNKFRPT